MKKAEEHPQWLVEAREHETAWIRVRSWNSTPGRRNSKILLPTTRRRSRRVAHY